MHRSMLRDVKTWKHPLDYALAELMNGLMIMLWSFHLPFPFFHHSDWATRLNFVWDRQPLEVQGSLLFSVDSSWFLHMSLDSVRFLD